MSGLEPILHAAIFMKINWFYLEPNSPDFKNQCFLKYEMCMCKICLPAWCSWSQPSALRLWKKIMSVCGGDIRMVDCSIMCMTSFNAFMLILNIWTAVWIIEALVVVTYDIFFLRNFQCKGDYPSNLSEHFKPLFFFLDCSAPHQYDLTLPVCRWTETLFTHLYIKVEKLL